VTRTTMRGARRALSALAAVAAASLALTGCLYSFIPAESGGAVPTGPTEIPTDLDGFYGQDVAWSNCEDGFQCATVLAPLDYDDPGAATIELAVIRHRAPGGTAAGSLLTNPGGPGGSGVSFLRDSFDYVFGEDLIDGFDIVSWDPRGVGASTAVTCLDAAGMDAYLYDIPDAPRGTPDWEAELTAANLEFAEACEANSDGILPYITTVNSARDLDLLRAVLGDEQLNYLGYSYGTFLGATYAELFPENTGRLVLDGAVDPTVSGTEMGTSQVIGFQNALRAYMADCLAGSDCPFRGTVDQALEDVAALLASLDRDPLPAADGRFLGADTMVTAIILPLYSEGNWPALTMAFDDVLQGDPGVAFYLADYYNDRVDGVYEGNSSEAFRAYNCVDYPLENLTDEEQAAVDARIAAEAPTFAPYWSGPDPCEVWTTPPTGTRGAIAAEGAAPIVVVGTTGDPATPYKWSVALAQQLASGVLVTNVGEGHTGYFKGNECVDAAVEAFLLENVVPADGSCG